MSRAGVRFWSSAWIDVIGLARLARWFFPALIGLLPAAAAADRLRLAVASNFRPAMVLIAGEFEAREGHELSVSYGSSGKHYAQIVNGAPYDIFLAADAEYPRRLEYEGIAVAGSRLTYAIGKLVLWSPVEGLFEDGRAVLAQGDFRFLAIANPATAPYGLAARQTMERLGVWEELGSRIARAENVGQAFAWVRSGNAELGFVALSQLKDTQQSGGDSRWLVPEDLHDPIEQEAVLLRDSPAARGFLDFLRGDRAISVIRRLGYGLPK